MAASAWFASVLPALAFSSRTLADYLRPIVVGSSPYLTHCIIQMHQETWVHRHLQACNFVFDPGWRRLHRQWCIHQLFAGRFQDDGAYHKWRVHLRRGDDDVYWKRKPLSKDVSSQRTTDARPRGLKAAISAVAHGVVTRLPAGQSGTRQTYNGHGQVSSLQDAKRCQRLPPSASRVKINIVKLTGP